MADEETHEEQQEDIQPKIVTYEEIASKIGWKPKEDFKGDPAKWSDAETWVTRTVSLNDGYKHELKSMKQTVDGMAKTFKASMDAQYQKGMQEVQEQRKEAIKAGDVESVELIDKHIDALKQQHTQETNDLKPEVKEFIARNQEWFDVDKRMTKRAVQYKDEFLEDNPSGSLTDALQYAEKELKRAFPDRFKAEQVDAPPSPEGTRQATSGKVDPIAKIKAHIFSDPDTKRVAKQFIDNGNMTEKEYFTALLSLPDYAHFNK